jgi:hypothetical protein
LSCLQLETQQFPNKADKTSDQPMQKLTSKLLIKQPDELIKYYSTWFKGTPFPPFSSIKHIYASTTTEKQKLEQNHHFFGRARQVPKGRV